MSDTFTARALKGHTHHTPNGFLVFNEGHKTKGIPEDLRATLEALNVIPPAVVADGSARATLERKTLVELIEIATEEGVIPDPEAMRSSLIGAIVDKADDEADASDIDLSQLDHDSDGEPGGSRPHDPPSLSGMNKAALIAQAEAEGVTLEEGLTNSQIIDAIEAAREVAGDDDAPVA